MEGSDQNLIIGVLLEGGLVDVRTYANEKRLNQFHVHKNVLF